MQVHYIESNYSPVHLSSPSINNLSFIGSLRATIYSQCYWWPNDLTSLYPRLSKFRYQNCCVSLRLQCSASVTRPNRSLPRDITSSSLVITRQTGLQINSWARFWATAGQRWGRGTAILHVPQSSKVSHHCASGAGAVCLGRCTACFGETKITHQSSKPFALLEQSSSKIRLPNYSMLKDRPSHPLPRPKEQLPDRRGGSIKTLHADSSLTLPFLSNTY